MAGTPKDHPRADCNHHPMRDLIGVALRMAIIILVIWPFLMVGCGMLPYDIAMVVTPIVALTPLLAITALVITFINPLALAVLAGTAFTSVGRRAFMLLSAIIGTELVVGAYFAATPVSYDRSLVPLLLLVTVTYCFLRFSGRAIVVRRLLDGQSFY